MQIRSPIAQLTSVQKVMKMQKIKKSKENCNWQIEWIFLTDYNNNNNNNLKCKFYWLFFFFLPFVDMMQINLCFRFPHAFIAFFFGVNLLEGKKNCFFFLLKFFFCLNFANLFLNAWLSVCPFVSVFVWWIKNVTQEER